jgi:hypothetical protein
MKRKARDTLLRIDDGLSCENLESLENQDESDDEEQK